MVAGVETMKGNPNEPLNNHAVKMLFDFEKLTEGLITDISAFQARVYIKFFPLLPIPIITYQSPPPRSPRDAQSSFRRSIFFDVKGG